MIDATCVVCHGEVIDGQRETREEIDLSSDESIRSTVPDLQALLDVIEFDEMPHEGKLSRRVRSKESLVERVDAIKRDYSESDKAELLAVEGRFGRFETGTVCDSSVCAPRHKRRGQSNDP